MQTPNVLSKIRKIESLLDQTVGEETLLYNERTHQAFCLNPLAAQVWKRLDGIQTPAGIAAAATLALGSPVTADLVLFAVDELRRDGLLETESAAPILPVPSRRALMRQIGAGAIMMLPVVAVVMAPKAAQAYTGCFDCDALPPDEAGDSLGGPKMLTPQEEETMRRQSVTDRTQEGGSPTLLVP